MDISIVVTYYSTLLTGALGLLGLLIAVLFVYIQMVSSQFTYRAASIILRAKLFYFFLFITILALLACSVALTAITFPSIGKISFWPFFQTLLAPTLGEFVQRIRYGLGTLGLVFLSVVISGGLMFYYAKLSYSSVVVTRITEAISTDSVFQYVERKFRGEPNQFLIKVVYGDTNVKPDKSNASKHNKKATVRKLGVDATDPIRSLLDIAVSALSRHDLASWRHAIESIQELAVGWLVAPKMVFIKPDEGYGFRETTGNYIVRYICENTAFLYETAIASGHQSLAIDILKAGAVISQKLAETGVNWSALREYLDYWEGFARSSIETAHRNETLVAINALYEIASAAVSSDEDRAFEPGNYPKEVFNETCKILGQIGERLVMKGIPERPKMPSGDITADITEFDEIVNSLTSFGGELRHRKLSFYALILLDAVDVISDRLIPLANNTNDIEETLFALWGIPRDLAIYAVEHADENNFGLCTLRLRQAFQKVSKQGVVLKELPDAIACWLVEIGFVAASSNREIKSWKSFDQKYGRDWIAIAISNVAVIPESHLRSAIQRELMDTLGDTGVEKAELFIERICKHLGICPDDLLSSSPDNNEPIDGN